MNTLKSIGAFLAGMLTVVILSIGTDAILENIGVFPSFDEQQKNGLFDWRLLLLALVYRCIYTIAGGYVTARLAPSNPMRHVIVLGSVGTVLATIGAIVGWHLSSHWYPIALVITALPCTWLGGKLKK
jgi:putative Mn2+ efflux pump MntP